MEENKIHQFKIVGKTSKEEAKEENQVSVTQEDIEKKTAELCELIKNYEGGKSDAAEWICFEIVNQASYNHYEALGVLAETMARYREVAMEVACEEDE